MSTENDKIPHESELSLAILPDGREFIAYEKRDGNGLGDYFIADQLGNTSEIEPNKEKKTSHVIFKDEIKSFRKTIGTAYLNDGRQMEIVKQGLGKNIFSDENFLLAVERIPSQSDDQPPANYQRSTIKQYFLAPDDINNIDWNKKTE